MTDAGKNVVAGTFTATGQSASFAVRGKFNALLSGGVATVAIEKSYDEGTTWYAIQDVPGTILGPFTMASDLQLNAVLEEIEASMLYRFNCTAFTSGTVTFRLSQSKSQ